MIKGLRPEKLVLELFDHKKLDIAADLLAEFSESLRKASNRLRDLDGHQTETSNNNTPTDSYGNLTGKERTALAYLVTLGSSIRGKMFKAMTGIDDISLIRLTRGGYVGRSINGWLSLSPKGYDEAKLRESPINSNGSVSAQPLSVVETPEIQLTSERSEGNGKDQKADVTLTTKDRQALAYLVGLGKKFQIGGLRPPDYNFYPFLTLEADGYIERGRGGWLKVTPKGYDEAKSTERVNADTVIIPPAQVVTEPETPVVKPPEHPRESDQESTMDLTPEERAAVSYLYFRTVRETGLDDASNQRLIGMGYVNVTPRGIYKLTTRGEEVAPKFRAGLPHAWSLSETDRSILAYLKKQKEGRRMGTIQESIGVEKKALVSLKIRNLIEILPGDIFSITRSGSEHIPDEPNKSIEKSKKSVQPKKVPPQITIPAEVQLAYGLEILSHYPVGVYFPFAEAAGLNHRYNVGQDNAYLIFKKLANGGYLQFTRDGYAVTPLGGKMNEMGRWLTEEERSIRKGNINNKTETRPTNGPVAEHVSPVPNAVLNKIKGDPSLVNLGKIYEINGMPDVLTYIVGDMEGPNMRTLRTLVNMFGRYSGLQIERLVADLRAIPSSASPVRHFNYIARAALDSNLLGSFAKGYEVGKIAGV